VGVSERILDRARAGDAHAFGELTEPYRPELHLHCYRLLGSVTDAEDALQETMIAAWRSIGTFAERASVRTWLYRIATNRALNARRATDRRKPLAPTPPFAPPQPTRHSELTWLQPYPDTLLEDLADTVRSPDALYTAREAVELAFIAGLQQLPPRQTATLILCDVLGFTLAEIAVMLETSPTAVKGYLQRARATLGRADRPNGEQVAQPGSLEERRLTRKFAEAFTSDDIDGVLDLLTDDAWLAMPPAPHEYQGRAAIAAFLKTSSRWRAGRPAELRPIRANGQPAFGYYLADPPDPTGRPAGLIVLDTVGDRISRITRFFTYELFEQFDLPAELDTISE